MNVGGMDARMRDDERVRGEGSKGRGARSKAKGARAESKTRRE